MTLSQLLAAPDRQPTLSGTVTYPTGTSLSFGPDQAMAFFLSEGAQSGTLLGGAFSAACSLTLNDQDAFFTAGRSPYGAHVRVYLDIGGMCAPLAVFTVSKVARRENDPRLTLSGSDAMGTAFEALFQDDFSYPLTLSQLAAHVAAQAGFTLSDELPNGSVLLSQRPDWGEISLRQALAFIACAAGSFACIDRDGALRLKPLCPASAPYLIRPEVTLGREYGDDRFGPLQGLTIRCTGAPRDASPLTVAQNGAVLNAYNSLVIDRNPLFPHAGSHTQVLADGLLSVLSGLTLAQAKVSWRGDPLLTLGDRVRIADTSDSITETQVTRQAITFSQGFSMQSDCLPPVNQPAVGRLFTASGAINAALLDGEMSGVLIRDGSLAAQALMAGSVTAAQLAAGAVTAEKISAGAVTAEKIGAGEVTAAHIAAGAVTAEKIDAGAVTADKLAAGSVQAGHLTASALEAMDARIGAADIDYAHIKDLAAGTALIERGSGEKLFIRRLAVDSAQMVDLAVGQLTVKARDGNYYSLSVDLDTGHVSATQVTVTAGELAAGQTASGQHIIETDLTVSELNTSSATATEALINRITAGRIDVDTLFAREATVNRLNALDISGNEYLHLYVGGQVDPVRQQVSGIQFSAAAGSQTLYAQGDSRLTPPADGWTGNAPPGEKGKVIWQKTVTTYLDGHTAESSPVCLSGADGEDATTLRIDSSRGTVFKNNAVSTVLSAVIYHGPDRITTAQQLRQLFGAGAHLQWSWQRMDESRFGVISASDSRIGSDGFTFTLSAADVDTKVTFLCELIV